MELIAGGLSILGSIIGAAMMKGELSEIEQNTRFTAIDVHGIRHGLATGEYAGVNLFASIDKTLMDTLWPLNWRQKAMRVVDQSMLAELKLVSKQIQQIYTRTCRSSSRSWPS